MHSICEPCCRADLLKSLVRSSSAKGDCSVCKGANLQVISTADRDFVLAIKALIRYHYSEWDYHTKLGGQGFESLLLRDNPLININATLDPGEYEDFLLSFLEDIDSDQQITLITAYGREIYNYLAMRAIAEGDSSLIFAVSRELTKRNHFLVEADYEERFRSIKDYVLRAIDAGTIWYRARIGATKRAADGDYSPNKDSYYYEPYSDRSLAAR